MGTNDSEGPAKRTPGTADEDAVVAAERLLCALHAHGVDYVFANLGTDHAPLLEAVAALRDAGRGDEVPEFVVCPHEFAAMSAAHGYAEVTGDPQAVLVHVDVGTQNLGAAMHNAHRSRVPLFVVAGLAPLTDDGYVGSRNNVVQYLQDTFDQSGVVREYCRWVDEYQPPADPESTVVRGLERALDVPQGPVYVSATREALETPIETPDADRSVREIRRPTADDADLDALAERVGAADAPLLVTSGYTTTDEARAMDVLVEFAEAAGAGVVEHAAPRLCFPHDHDLYVGANPAPAFEDADLLVVADVDVPWVPWQGTPDSDTPVVQIDPSPTKPTYPRWDFRVDETLVADPVRTLAAVTDRLDGDDGAAGRETWGEMHRAQAVAAAETVADHREADRLTPAVVSAALDDAIDDSTVVVNDATTSARAALAHLDLTEPGSYRNCSGAGLGWGTSAAVGVKLADPEKRVVSLVGDGSYTFANPTACAWMAAAHDAPTLTVVYNNSGWNAVSLATLNQHPEGLVTEHGVLGSEFDPRMELAHPAKVVGAHTATVTTPGELGPALVEAIDAVDAGTPAVLDVHVEPVSGTEGV